MGASLRGAQRRGNRLIPLQEQVMKPIPLNEAWCTLISAVSSRRIRGGISLTYEIASHHASAQENDSFPYKSALQSFFQCNRKIMIHDTIGFEFD